MIDGAKVQHFF